MRTLTTFVVAAILVGCGGDDEDLPKSYQPAYTTPEVTAALAGPESPIRHVFDHAARYRLTIRGTLNCAQHTEKMTASVYFSMSGNSTLSGDAYNDFPIITCAVPVNIERSVNLSLSGAGPWQMEIRTFLKEGQYGPDAATISHLALTVEEAATTT